VRKDLPGPMNSEYQGQSAAMRNSISPAAPRLSVLLKEKHPGPRIAFARTC